MNKEGQQMVGQEANWKVHGWLHDNLGWLNMAPYRASVAGTILRLDNRSGGE